MTTISPSPPGRLRRLWMRLRLWAALWALTQDPIAVGIVLARHRYPLMPEETARQRQAREAETLAFSLRWCRDHGAGVTADRVRAVLSVLGEAA